MKFTARLASAARGFVNRLTAPARIVRRLIAFGHRTDAGVHIDGDSMLRDATVWACIQYLSKTVAQLTCRVMASTPDGGAVVAVTHPADWLLHKRPNPEMGSFTFRQTLMGWAVRYGNGYAEIERDARGAVFALWPLHPNRVEPKRDPGTGKMFYRAWNELGGGYVDLEPMDMFHIRGFGDGPVGLSVVEYAAESIGWARATQIFGATFFSEGMNPSGIVEVKKALSGPAMTVLREELEGIYKGPRGRRTAILDADMKFTKSTTNPNDAQFIETRQHQVEEICRWFGVPPHKVMHLLRATFSNIEHLAIEVVIDSITPWVKVWEDEADYKLFGPRNRQGFFVKMNLKSLLRGDNASRATLYTKLFSVAGMTVNDILRAEDENPIGPKGDVRFVPVNMMTLDRAIAMTGPVTAEELKTASDPSVFPPDETQTDNPNQD